MAVTARPSSHLGLRAKSAMETQKHQAKQAAGSLRSMISSPPLGKLSASLFQI